MSKPIYTPPNADAGWFKSSYSASNSNCVEMSMLMPNIDIAIRDSKEPRRPFLRVTERAWSRFISELKRNPSLSSAVTA
ncbi:DUF397 domain-containing protein [Streptomyces mobaraensis NBRC 13819 = DSM 40847]|uniref:Uncharacterized protein n=1 Tax=Streptomyces mobaraensis (strain ATCC 29032 / DSM 40847 / JCM 4168 / NBRC 13819 / NCIMB 11159 / IPCR 16-22) TaxID=1223523 RepID=M3CE49_STRM1|nr:DUF397 domain-containing protein [Streptomyces mobaraensis]EMF02352.1 hypothetical protein H340_00849 [Streptomyces mobaraensis NBRC 13819 = DSM 40847]QTT76994.1 DUF397 domain-containing protein [Streptomyces mobaraensis NBRC 13819 = DSM 40847]